MALDTKQKRGSVLGLSLPFRNWQSEPAGEFDVGGRLSLLRLFAGIATEGGDIILGPYCICAASVSVAGAVAGSVSLAGAVAAGVHLAGSEAGQGECC